MEGVAPGFAAASSPVSASDVGLVVDVALQIVVLGDTALAVADGVESLDVMRVQVAEAPATVLAHM